MEFKTKVCSILPFQFVQSCCCTLQDDVKNYLSVAYSKNKLFITTKKSGNMCSKPKQQHFNPCNPFNSFIYEAPRRQCTLGVFILIMTAFYVMQCQCAVICCTDACSCSHQTVCCLLSIFRCVNEATFLCYWPVS